nr:hypothetical protein [Clostridium muellerianum]
MTYLWSTWLRTLARSSTDLLLHLLYKESSTTSILTLYSEVSGTITFFMIMEE